MPTIISEGGDGFTFFRNTLIGDVLLSCKREENANPGNKISAANIPIINVLNPGFGKSLTKRSVNKLLIMPSTKKPNNEPKKTPTTPIIPS